MASSTPDFFRMGGKELASLAEGRSKNASLAQAEIDRRKAKKAEKQAHAA